MRPLNVAGINIGEVIQTAKDQAPDLDTELNFYAAALSLGATTKQADRLDEIACASHMRALGMI